MKRGKQPDLTLALARSGIIDRGLWDIIEGLELIATDRRRLAGGAFKIGLEIHASIATLLRSQSYASAFILLRSSWEATTRGFWLLECATDQQLEQFAADKLSLKSWHMIDALESIGSFSRDTLSRIHAANWPKMNAMNHISGPLVVRGITADGFGQNFDDAELIECLEHASSNAVLCAMGIVQAAARTDLGLTIYALQAQVFGTR